MKEREQYILELALNLNRAVNASDRFERLLDIFRQAIPCDAACLMRKEGGELIPLSSYGLVEEVLYRRFPLQEHPRLQIISQSKEPIIFPHDSQLADPFDGLMLHDKAACLDVHSCLGCPLIVENEVMGLLTADALQTHQFDEIDLELLNMIAALAGATLRTSLLIDQLEHNASEMRRISQSLVKEANVGRETPLLGVSPAMEEIRRTIDMVAASDFSILITGETGTGKEVVARHIHEKSLRCNEPLIYVNCAALPESIAESELFGHKKGAFTGAHADRIGKFELAQGGTLFLDEIGELPLSIQPKFLRALQEGEIQKVGSDQVRRVNVRVIAATNRDLEKEIEAGKFRSDLYHRLNAYPLRMPALRERRDDIVILASYFCDMFHKKLGTASVRLDEGAKNLLNSYPWPGNVRELKNMVSRAILNAHHKRGHLKVLLLMASDFEGTLSSESWSPGVDAKPSGVKGELFSLKEATVSFQRSYILETLHRHQNNWSQTARALGVHRSNLHHLAKRLGLLGNDKRE